METLRTIESVTHGKGTLVFTDGSNIDGEVGAGYVLPKWSTQVAMKVRGPQTVNRAEMTSQLAAL